MNQSARQVSTQPVCAVVVLEADEFRSLSEAKRRSRKRYGRKNPAGEWDIWDFEPYLTAPEWRLFYRIVELGGQIGIFAHPRGYNHAIAGAVDVGPRLRVYKTLLPKALSPIHLEETMHPVPEQPKASGVPLLASGVPL